VVSSCQGKRLKVGKETGKVWGQDRGRIRISGRPRSWTPRKRVNDVPGRYRAQGTTFPPKLVTGVFKRKVRRTHPNMSSRNCSLHSSTRKQALAPQVPTQATPVRRKHISTSSSKCTYMWTSARDVLVKRQGTVLPWTSGLEMPATEPLPEGQFGRIPSSTITAQTKVIPNTAVRCRREAEAKRKMRGNTAHAQRKQDREEVRELSRKEGVSTRLQAPKSTPAKPSPEQEKLGPGWNHIVRGGRVVKAQATPSPASTSTDTGRRTERQATQLATNVSPLVLRCRWWKPSHPVPNRLI
jgi:hypothetical protein